MERKMSETCQPKRIHCKRSSGWAKPFGAVCVTRPSYFGNPFRVGVGSPFRFTRSGKLIATKSLRAVPDAAHAVGFFRAWLASAHGKTMRRMAREHLRGKDLCCWCPLDQPCHADVLLEIANKDPEDE